MSAATTIRRTERAVTFERTFRSSRERMFEAFTTPELLLRWWGPPDWPAVSCTVDLRPGGIWHYCLRAADGREHWARSVYREIIRPVRIAYVENSSDPLGAVTDEFPPALTVVTFAERDGVTRLRSHVTFSDPRHLDAALARGMAEGFPAALGLLDDLLISSEGKQT
jgi:uncharacterized protein YndB with AHSA1/START domain